MYANAEKPGRILVVGINYAPENIGTGKYTSEMCSWLAARGHQVRVVTTAPYYPAWRVWPGYRRWWFSKETIGGVEVIRCPCWVPANPNGLRRLLHLGSFGITSLLALLVSLAWRPGQIIAIAPTLAAAPGAWLSARLSGARCWLHIQDFELDAMLDMGIVKVGYFKRMAQALERWLLRRFDRVSTISAKMLGRLESKGVSAGKRVFFANWADIDAIHPLSASSPYRAELGIPGDAVVALYSGNMGLKQGLELLGETAQEISPDAGIFFVFGGEGPARDQLEGLCAGLPTVRFLGLQPTERLNDWLGLADIHLLPQRADVADLVMPSKMTGMLASGRPVLATAVPGTGVANALQQSGVVVPPGDKSAFVAALRELALNPGLRLRLGRAARAQAESTLARDGILLAFESQLFGGVASPGAFSQPDRSNT